MKKIIVMLLAAVLLLSLCACGADVPEGDALPENAPAAPETGNVPDAEPPAA